MDRIINYSALETWLKQAPTDPAEDIQTASKALAAFCQLTVPASARQSLLASAAPRVLADTEQLCDRLRQARLPLSSRTRRTLDEIKQSLDLTARGLLNTVEAPESSHVKGVGIRPEKALHISFRCLSSLQLSCLLSSSPLTEGFWTLLHRAYIAARKQNLERLEIGDPSTHCLNQYLRMLVLGNLPLSGLNAEEWHLAHQYLNQCTELGSVHATPPGSPFDQVLWIEPDRDQAPISLARREPAAGVKVVYIDVGKTLSGLEGALKEKSPGPIRSRGLDLIAAPQAEHALNRLLSLLRSPKKRRFPRRRQGYRAELTLGFDATFRRLTDRFDDDASSVWMVVNESPGGYAAMHVSGEISKVRVGDLIGMRRAGGQEWACCLVRWAASDNPEHLELGLEELAPRAEPCRVGSLDADPGEPGAPALHLPPLPPLRANELLVIATSIQPPDGSALEVRALGDPTTRIVRRDQDKYRFIGLRERSSAVLVCDIEPLNTAP